MSMASLQKRVSMLIAAHLSRKTTTVRNGGGLRYQRLWAPPPGHGRQDQRLTVGLFRGRYFGVRRAFPTKLGRDVWSWDDWLSPYIGHSVDWGHHIDDRGRGRGET